MYEVSNVEINSDLIVFVDCLPIFFSLFFILEFCLNVSFVLLINAKVIKGDSS